MASVEIEQRRLPDTAGWRTPLLIIVCGCAIALLSFGPRSALGFFVQPMSREFAWGRDIFGLALAVQNLLWGLGQPIAGAIADRCRHDAVLGAVVRSHVGEVAVDLDLGMGMELGRPKDRSPDTAEALELCPDLIQRESDELTVEFRNLHDIPWLAGRSYNIVFVMISAVWIGDGGHSPGRFQPAPERSAAYNRGAYLVTALAHCGECHTPRNWFGAAEPNRFLAGNPDGPDGNKVPNITPDGRTGIGHWSEDDIVYLLKAGGTPDGDFVGGSMAEIVRNTSRLTDDDRRAIAAYLKALPPKSFDKNN